MALSGDLISVVSRLGMIKVSRRLGLALWCWNNDCGAQPFWGRIAPKAPQYLQMYFRVPCAADHL